MQILDCYDPAAQEERRQAEWDAKCNASPRCEECGSSLYPHDTYTELGGKLYCGKCVYLGTHSTDSLEV